LGLLPINGRDFIKNTGNYFVFLNHGSPYYVLLIDLDYLERGHSILCHPSVNVDPIIVVIAHQWLIIDFGIVPHNAVDLIIKAGFNFLRRSSPDGNLSTVVDGHPTGHKINITAHQPKYRKVAFPGVCPSIWTGGHKALNPPKALGAWKTAVSLSPAIFPISSALIIISDLLKIRHLI
jgi:hypothetical protein